MPVVVIGAQQQETRRQQIPANPQNDRRVVMPKDTYWNGARAELRDLVQQLRPDDALEIVKKLIRTDNDEQLASMLAGLIRGFVARRADEQRHTKEAV
jgi:hypothetical protein